MNGAVHLVLVAGFVLVFGYFQAAGATLFERDETDVAGAGWGQFSFLVTGAIGVSLLSFRHEVRPGNAIAAGVLLLAALLLYQWSRRTIRERHFPIAWSGDVPDAVCDGGPYAHVRHPVYLSYIVAFLAAPVAFPTIAMLGIFLFNAALFTHAARADERDLAASPLGEAYAAYKARTGMFVPRWRKAQRA